METKQVIGGVLCSLEPKPPKGSKVTFCEKCKRAIWIGARQIKLKQERKELPIFCNKCVEQSVTDAEVVIVPVDDKTTNDDIDHIVKGIRSDSGENLFERLAKKVSDGDEGLQEAVKQAQIGIVAGMRKAHENFREKTEQTLPMLLQAIIPHLDITNRLEDLLIGSMIGSLVEDILLKRADELGDGEIFSRYSTEESLTIVGFLMGVSKGVELVTKDRERFEHATTEEASKGWRRWWDNFFEGLEGDVEKLSKEIGEFQKRHSDDPLGRWVTEQLDKIKKKKDE